MEDSEFFSQEIGLCVAVMVELKANEGKLGEALSI